MPTERDSPIDPEALIERIERELLVRPGELIEFIDELRRDHEYNIGIGRFIVVQNLLIALAAQGKLRATPQELKAWLTPLLCTSPKEQNDFGPHFERWLAKQPQTSPAAPAPDPRLPPPPPPIIRPSRRDSFRYLWRRRKQLALVGMVAVVAIALFILFKTNGQPPINYNSNNSPTPLVTPPASPSPDLVPMATEDQPGIVYSARETPRQPKPPPRSRWEAFLPYLNWLTYGIAGLAPLIFVGWWANSLYRRRSQLEKWRTNKAPRPDRIVVRGIRERLFKNSELRRAARELRRYRRLRSDDLDAPATINSTILNGGLFTPVYGSRRALPEYLVLIDRSSFSDQQAKLADEFFNRLCENDILLDRYYFSRDPRICQKGGPEAAHLTLQDLEALHPDHYLVIFSDGAGLINSVTGRPQGWLNLFSSWTSRALLTPEPLPDWGYSEWILATSGFVVLPARTDSLRVLTEVSEGGASPKIMGADRSLPYPSILQQRSDLWLDRDEPPSGLVNKLCRQLSRYLGDQGYYLLSACAIYPMLQWDITLYLTFRVIEREKAEDTLFWLVRLPWFRQGVMPDWLRLRLISEMSTERELTVRRELEILLTGFLRGSRKGFHLSVVPEPIKVKDGWLSSNFKRGYARLAGWKRKRWLRYFIRNAPEKSPLRDYVFMNFMSGSKLALSMPDVLRRFLFRKRIFVSGLRPIAALTLAVVSAIFWWTLVTVAFPVDTVIPVVPPAAAGSSPVPSYRYGPISGMRGEQHQLVISPIDCEQSPLAGVRLLPQNGSGITVTAPNASDCQLTAAVSIAPSAQLGKTQMLLMKGNQSVGTLEFTVSDQPCPSIKIRAPDGAAQSPLIFTVQVEGAKVQALTYRWEVVGGNIESGQGTPTISIAVDQSLSNQSITATVKVTGLNVGCPSAFSAVPIVNPQGPPVLPGHCGDPPPANPSKCNVNKQFIPGCNLPWTGGQAHEVDQSCPNEGCAQRDSDLAQNQIKNNLCAKGTPVQISFASIDKLQAVVDKLVQQGQLNYGKTGPPSPADRAKLSGLVTVDKNGHPVTLGEGSLVTIEGLVLDAKHDDTFPFGFGGESVNCKNSLLEWNDIHVDLAESASATECSSVTAEIIPHFRPAVWDRFDSNACTAPHVTNPLPVKGIRVRMTGQLFFDGSHLPSPCGVPSRGGNPLRRSVWEIHPVYAIEVLDKIKNVFVPLDQWAQGK
jgi:hypothetical protein